MRSFGVGVLIVVLGQAVFAGTETARAADLSFGAFLWLAFAMGALSLLTPCVFPMIPITVSYFTNHAAGSRRAALRSAGLYCLGIVLTFTGLGMALALLVGASGINQFAANPWINLAIAAVFLGLALNLFGVYFIQVPSALLTWLGDRNIRGGGATTGTLLMGLTFTLTSFTCTVPFMGTMLVMASQGTWTWPLAGMFAFSLAFAAPFFLLALGPQLLAQLPRSGGWLNSVKIVMAFLEVAAAMKFLSNADLVWNWHIFTREMVLAVWVLLGLLIVLYLLGMLRLGSRAPAPSRGAASLASAIGFAVVTVWLAAGLTGRSLGEMESFLPPATPPSVDPAPQSAELSWLMNDYDAALERGRREARLVFIDFTGYTCTNCRWMEANMFTRPEVRRELERFVRVRLYTDGDGEVYRNQQRLQQKKFGTVALPLYAIVQADGTPVASFPGLTRSLEEFLSFLKTDRIVPASFLSR